MFRSLVKRIYWGLLYRYNGFKYYILPNLLSKVKTNIDRYPIFNQKTFITGLGELKIGKDCSFGARHGGFNYCGSVELQPRTKNSMIIIGDNVSTNNNVFISSCNKIIIGSHTLIGQNVSIMDYEAHGIDPESRRSIGEIGKVVVEENVWIGNNVIILKNTKIGNNTIIAAGAIVAGEFPPNVIIGGVPAKIIKKI